MGTFVTVIHCVTCVLLVIVVLMQSGKGAEISASFGGSSQTVFGSSGGANFFTRFTQGAALVFMVTSVTLTVMGGKAHRSVMEAVPATVPAPATTSVPTNVPAAPFGQAPAQSTNTNANHNTAA